MKYLFLLIFYISIMSCSVMNKQKVTIIGKAEDAKAGAVVISKDNKKMYYIDGLSNWDSKMLGKLVKVSGVLTEINSEEQKENEPIKQQLAGIKRVILNPKFDLVSGNYSN